MLAAMGSHTVLGLSVGVALLAVCVMGLVVGIAIGYQWALYRETYAAYFSRMLSYGLQMQMDPSFMYPGPFGSVPALPGTPPTAISVAGTLLAVKMGHLLRGRQNAIADA